MRTAVSREPIEIETAPSPTASMIILHGLGADGSDFVPVAHELDLGPVGPVRFVFPHAPVRPVTINNGYVMPRLVRHLRLRHAGPARGRRRPAPVAGAGRGADRAREGARHPGAADRARRLQPGLRDDADDGAAPRGAPRRPGLPVGLPAAGRRGRGERHESNRDVPIFMAHGTHGSGDRDRPGAGARATPWSRLGHAVEWHEYPMPHSVCAEEIADLEGWLRRALA